ncbi:hypothetical protein MKW92_043142 [Papaver armeniacum]|nr:hypothetical protein MKW92_043142 [Papaver armeniacum]
MALKYHSSAASIGGVVRSADYKKETSDGIMMMRSSPNKKVTMVAAFKGSNSSSNKGVIKFKSHRNNHCAQLTHSMPPEKLEIFKSLETQEALPTYQTILTTLDGVKDETGVSSSPWAARTRAWSGEENRHGDLLNKYLYLSWTCRYEATRRWKNSPYLGFIYTTFQERATFISHGNTARLAKAHGDIKLAQICGTIAADEKRHEIKKITMPAHLMFDGQDDNLFENYSDVAQRLGVYTAKDYAEILELLWCQNGRLRNLLISLQKMKDPKYLRHGKNAQTHRFSWVLTRKCNSSHLRLCGN